MLRTSPLFRGLESGILSDVAAHVQLREVPGGSKVFAEGESSDFMLVVVSGRLRVTRDTKDGLLLYNEICPGQSVGELGLILRQPRTADVNAVRDSLVAVLDRPAFEQLMQRHPLELNAVFSQAIFNHLRHTNQFSSERNARCFALFPLDDRVDIGAVARHLHAALSTLGKAYHVRPGEPGDPGSGSDRDRESIDVLERQNDFLVLESDGAQEDAMVRTYRQADQLIFVASHDARPDEDRVRAFLARQPGFSLKRQHRIVHQPAGLRFPKDMQPWREEPGIERVYPLRDGHAPDYARLARFLTERAVGVVLGGGGARGFAHLGVLRALHEAQIPIDLVGGNSMGALLGAQYACENSLDDILAWTLRFCSGGERPTMPLVSLLAGQRIARDLRRVFGDIRIEDLWQPYFAAACNLTLGCTTVQDRGLLWRAVLASNSPAGLLPPVVHDGQLLVDGAILDNVPVEAMRVRLGTPLEKRRGNGTVIAIDVDVPEQMRVDPAVTRLSASQKFMHRFKPSAPPLPGIGDILYRASHIGSANQRGRTMSLADRYLEPPVGEFALMDYKRADAIVETGYRYASEQIARWNSHDAARAA